MKRLNLSLDDIVYSEIDEFCKAKNCSKSGLVSTACTAYISAIKAVPEVQSQIDELRQALLDLQQTIDEKAK